MKDFFISRNGADRAWAEWIAWTLEEAGYSVVLQDWDFLQGANFVLRMQEAATGTRKTIVVLSEAYLEAEFTQPEWAAAFAEDPRGKKRKLIPLRVAPCSPPGLLGPLIYADLVGLSDEDAKRAVLTAVADQDRAKPAQRPAFPGAGTAASTSPSPAAEPPPPVSFPGGEPPGRKALAVWREKLEFLLAQEAVVSDPNQKFALHKQIAEAREKIRELKR
jgi:hypothetical protein